MLISELKTKGEPFQGAQHKNGNWWIEVDPNQKIDGVVEGEFIRSEANTQIFKFMSENNIARASGGASIFRTGNINGYDCRTVFIPYIPRKTTRPMTAKEVWELWKSNHGMLVKRKGWDATDAICGFDLACTDGDPLLIDGSWESIEDIIYTLDFGETWQEFEVTENG